MTRQRLAQQLREVQIEMQLNPAFLVMSLTDDQIIDAYTTCSCCGEHFAPEEVISNLIEKANDANAFLNSLGRCSRNK